MLVLMSCCVNSCFWSMLCHSRIVCVSKPNFHDPSKFHLTVAYSCLYSPQLTSLPLRSALYRVGLIYRPPARLIGLYCQTYIIGLHQTLVPGFEGRQTHKPGFEKYPPGLHSLVSILVG